MTKLHDMTATTFVGLTALTFSALHLLSSAIDALQGGCSGHAACSQT